MRLGLVIYGSLETLSGGYFYDRRLVDYLRAQGDSVEIFSLPWRRYAAHLADNFKFRLPSGLDLLIEDELNHPSLLAANLRRACPVISLVHHLRCSEQRPAWQNLFYRQVEKSYLRGVDGFIFNSQTTRKVVTALVGDSQPAILAYPPTDRFGAALADDFVAARARQPRPLQIVFLGSLIARKGLPTLLQALASLPQQDFQLDIIGSASADPPYAAQLRRCAAALPIAAQFHGALADAPLAEKLTAADLLVVPSSYEGFGIVYLEGMRFGLPAIGATTGAAAEVIDPGQTGFLVAPGDWRALAARLDELAHNRALLADLSLRALARYRRQPGWPQTAAAIRRFLQKEVERG